MVVVESRFPGGMGLLMTAQRKLVLGLASDRVAIREDLSALAQWDGPAGVHRRVDHSPAERGRVQRLVMRRESLR